MLAEIFGVDGALVLIFLISLGLVIWAVVDVAQKPTISPGGKAAWIISLIVGTLLFGVVGLVIATSLAYDHDWPNATKPRGIDAGENDRLEDPRGVRTSRGAYTSNSSTSLLTFHAINTFAAKRLDPTELRDVRRRCDPTNGSDTNRRTLGVLLEDWQAA
jgi:hypothetical protein